MCFLLWNVRGVAGNIFAKTIRLLKGNHNPSFLVVFEPRISGAKAFRAVKKLGFSNFFIEGANGFSRGIWFLWV